MRPSWMILSSSEPFPFAAAAAAAAAGWAAGCSADWGCSSGIYRSSFGLDLLQGIVVIHNLLQQAIQVVVSVKFREQVGELVARIEQLLERRHLLDDSGRTKVIHVLETEFGIDEAASRREL